MGTYSPTPDPQILPPAQRPPVPEYERPPLQQPVRRKQPSWKSSPATYLLVGINCAVFLAMTLDKVDPFRPTIGQLLFWQADNAGAVLLAGKWWRIATAMFVHVGILHLA